MTFLHSDMTRVVEILPQVRQGTTYIFYIVNVMAADILATQESKASATMILTILNRIKSVPARFGLTSGLLFSGNSIRNLS